MATIDSWGGNIAEIGPMYPFAGTEVLLVLLGLAFWIAFHVLQSRAESRLYDEELAKFGNEEGLKQALDLEAVDTSERN